MIELKNVCIAAAWLDDIVVATQYIGPHGGRELDQSRSKSHENNDD